MTAEHILAALVDAGRQCVDSGLVLASGGNLSARLPGTDTFAVTAAGSRLDRLTERDFAIVRLDGEPRAGTDAATPSSEWRLHRHTYLARPDVEAVVHVHPEYAVLVDAMGERIRQLTLDHVAYAPVITRVPFHPNGSLELAEATAAATRHSDCVVLAHHGCSTVGTSPQDALRKAQNLESAARYTYRLLTLGNHTTEFPQPARTSATQHH
ncbi:class II aldolase/adducin family protein [Embleya hyalina]|uniref:L-ribulose-5-phosphate 4-epimerase n=1 Tax=Embleya hyalina TaxID=516124 RepID=A0A401YE27_9ACTN|nr:class II aldolase/adducin family protein [Embleya hyalina]GCD92869.1 L-ribulose-5-phosphate 4-epimerase [Embleya hyalina]